jgi:hypothetical protein
MSQLVKTKRQANFKDFKRFGVGGFKGLLEQNKTCSCVNWALFGMSVPLKLVSLAF